MLEERQDKEFGSYSLPVLISYFSESTSFVGEASLESFGESASRYFFSYSLVFGMVFEFSPSWNFSLGKNIFNWLTNLRSFHIFLQFSD